MNNQNITWNNYPLETVAEDGTVLKGTIHYWAKDYTIYLTEPFEAEGCGSHLMYAIPARYVTDEAPRNGQKNIPLIPIAKENLISLYAKKEH